MPCQQLRSVKLITTKGKSKRSWKYEKIIIYLVIPPWTRCWNNGIELNAKLVYQKHYISTNGEIWRAHIFSRWVSSEFPSSIRTIFAQTGTIRWRRRQGDLSSPSTALSHFALAGQKRFTEEYGNTLKSENLLTYHHRTYHVFQSWLFAMSKTASRSLPAHYYSIIPVWRDRARFI